MRVGLLTVRFYLEGCRSLKEKRQRLSGLRERFGRQSSVAVCESGYQDDHTHAEWSFLAVTTNTNFLDRIFDRIETYVDGSVDAQVIASERENL